MPYSIASAGVSWLASICCSFARVVALAAAWVMRLYPLGDRELARIQDELRLRREAVA